MAQLYKKLTRLGRSILAFGAVVGSVLFASPANIEAKTPVIRQDPGGDARVLRTDEDDGDSPFDAGSHRLPDIIETRLGTFQPYWPATNLFSGEWSVNGGFIRLDIVFEGLINPPGLVGMADIPLFAPYMYGPNPVFGFIELDVDANENTGGEIDFAELRFLGNVARLGGSPEAVHYANRVAISHADFDHYVPSAPYVDRSGEEFHLSLVGEEIESISVVVESDCGAPATFDEGEIWQLTGHWLHRAHSFEQFSLQCFSAEGRYMPVSVLQFRHSCYSNRTTVSLVFPLRNAAHADMQVPAQPVQPNNGCPGDQYSIEEGLEDLRYSAINVDPVQAADEAFPLMAEWALQLPAASLNPAQWRINACLGSAYPEEQSGNARFVWSDMYPNVVNRDYTGDGLVTIADVQAFQAFMNQHDGDPTYDDDECDSNNSIELCNFSRNFCLFDSNYDGYVNENDVTRLGDMDWNGEVSCADIDDLALGLLNPAEYEATYPGKQPEKHGDMDGNSILDGRDIQVFVHYLMSQP